MYIYMKSILCIEIVWECLGIRLYPFMQFRNLINVLIEDRCDGFLQPV